MRLDHIITSSLIFYEDVKFLVSILIYVTVWVCLYLNISSLSFDIVIMFIMPGDHDGEVIPVPIPNTEVKLSSADDTADQVGK